MNRYTNGIDLNCGCPQKWAIHEHIGAYLMDCPELVRDMVKQVHINYTYIFIYTYKKIFFIIKIFIIKYV